MRGERPPVHQDLLERALRCERRGRFGEAIALLNLVLEDDPENAMAWRHLAALQSQYGRVEAAIACYRRAAALDPGSVSILSNLGLLYLDDLRPEEAIIVYRLAAELEPDKADNFHNLGVALYEAGHAEEALDAFRHACELNPEHPNSNFMQSTLLLHDRQFEEGWFQYRWRWELKTMGRRPTHIPEWAGESFEGKSLVLLPEQGHGDTIWASRFVPLVKARGGTVVMQTRPEVRSLLSQLKGIDRFIDHTTPISEFDMFVPMMSLPGLLDITDMDTPPAKLHVSEEAADRLSPYFERAGRRFKVAIVWSGSHTNARNRSRAAPLEFFIELAQNPDVQLFNLQKGPQEHELTESQVSALVIDVPNNDFSEAAAIIEAVDLVVMTDSAIAHVAGSLGRPVWNLQEYLPYWLYGPKGSDTPWYPSMRLFRQRKIGDWVEVFARVRTALVEAVAQYKDGRWPPARDAV